MICRANQQTGFYMIVTLVVKGLTELINDNALSLARNLSFVPLKLLLTIPAVSVLGLILCIAKFIDERKWCCSYADLAKTYNLLLTQNAD